MRIKPHSIFNDLRLKEGDVLKRVNEQDILTSNQLLSLFETLQVRGHLSITFERSGRIVTHKISMPKD